MDDHTLKPAVTLVKHARTPFPGANAEEMADPGEDPRQAPDIASLWSILDLTPGRRAWVGAKRKEGESQNKEAGSGIRMTLL